MGETQEQAVQLLNDAKLASSANDKVGIHVTWMYPSDSTHHRR